MHILVVNDDGPPSPHSSPYVHSLVHELQAAGHLVSVCLPHTQRSWIGKAHMIGQTLKPVYYRPPQPPSSSASTFFPAGLSPENDDHPAHGTTHDRPSRDASVEEWVLVDGTPASCVQIGLFHYFQERGPFDLVVSGPNYGRNTTAVFALSSGTLGGALEAAACRHKAIALSYAFFTRNHDPEIVAGASRHSVRVIEALIKQWPSDGSVDLYSVNVPLVEGVEGAKTLFAPLLQNYWTLGNSAFEAVAAEEEKDRGEEEERIRRAEIEGGGGETNDSTGGAKGHEHRHFKWAPQLGDVMKSTEQAPPHVDGKVIRAGNTCVTPLKANFWHAAEHLHEQELKLTAKESASSLQIRTAETLQVRDTSVKTEDVDLKDIIYAIIDYEDAYVQPLILSALQSLIPPHRLHLLPPSSSPASSSLPAGAAGEYPQPEAKILQIRAYESIDFEHATAHPRTSLINSYVIRKALIRKHFLSTTVDHWVAKHRESLLRRHVKSSESFEVDYAEFLDDALDETFDLRASLLRNEEIETSGGGGEEGDDKDGGEGGDKKEWWILKPAMSDRGQGIRLFSTMEKLQEIFDGWEAEAPESDEEEEEEEEAGAEAKTKKDGDGGGDYITTSHLRHFVAQPYIHPPLLLPSCANRKFHIRTYVLCVGALRVYVARDMLALFAGRPYFPPWEQQHHHNTSSPSTAAQEDRDDSNNSNYYLDAHLTNTCLQGPRADATSVQRFWDLSAADLPPARKDAIFAQVCAVTGEVFEAAARGMMVHFQPLPFAFEVFGLDFLVDAGDTAWLLEVNAFPDFKQTGDGLRGVVEGFWRGAVRLAVGPWAGVLGAEKAEAEEESEGLVLVRDVELGQR